jgi:SAM-dependent methyltransferase
VGGRSLRFSLSQSLFASHDIDQGSRLLLAAVRRRLPAAAFGSILDMGCGVGVLGLALKVLHPEAELTLSDRDALALAFSRLNAGLNGLEPVRWGGHLGFSGLAGRGFDLIVSNLPAKAGPPVLRHFLDSFSACLNPEGLFVLVIVNTLEETVSRALKEIVFKERGREHTVLCCRPQAASVPEGLEAYVRGRFQFAARGLRYSLETVYGLAGFDTLSHDTASMFALLDRYPPSGRTLIWNPGQGHVPAALAAAGSCELSLGSRDLLQLAVSARNLSPLPAECRHLPAPDWLEEPFDNLIVFPDAEPGAVMLLARCCTRLLRPRGRLYLADDSTRAGRFLRACQGLRLACSKKSRGTRALLLSRED